MIGKDYNLTLFGQTVSVTKTHGGDELKEALEAIRGVGDYDNQLWCMCPDSNANGVNYAITFDTISGDVPAIQITESGSTNYSWEGVKGVAQFVDGISEYSATIMIFCLLMAMMCTCVSLQRTPLVYPTLLTHTCILPQGIIKLLL